MGKITPFLWYDNQAEEAAKLYTSIFKNSKILSVSRYGEGSPLPAGTAMTVNFILDGQEFIALNGGPHDKFNDSISFLVNCQTQAEVDEYWNKLTANGGQEGRCGWLKDKFGLSWQIIPTALGELMGDPDPVKAQSTMQAMLQMNKIDIAGLKRAHDQPTQPANPSRG